MKGVCILSVSLLHMACDVISHEPMNIARFTFPILASMLLAGGLAIMHWLRQFHPMSAVTIILMSSTICVHLRLAKQFVK